MVLENTLWRDVADGNKLSSDDPFFFGFVDDTLKVFVRILVALKVMSMAHFCK